MNFLRTASTRRLLTTIVGAVAVIIAGTAIALAATSAGPVPKKTSLANALHTAASAPAPQGITARITFTNHLIDASDIQGSDPLINGASGRLWISENHQLRLELQGANGDAQVVVNHQAFWIYDPTSNTVYEGTLPADAMSTSSHAQDAIPSVGQIQSDLTRLMSHVNLSGAIPGDVAGRPAYTVRISPQHDGGLLGDAEMAWDAARGVPLRVAVYARNDSSPVLELKATSISYGSVSQGVFAISPPAGAKVVTFPTSAGSAPGQEHSRQHAAPVTGVAAVARRVPFALVAPKTLVGLQRQSVSLLNWKGRPAALVTYGHDVGAIAVIEQAAAAHSGSSSQSGASSDQGGDGQGVTLPTVSINGATGQELDTALGTMVSFSRAGVSYTVIGSVPPTAADLAARAL